jgi:hypothetical protein
VNPLNLPQWGKKPKPFEKKVDNFLGIQNEVVRDDAGAKDHIVIQALGGIKGTTPQTYKVAYVEGQTLGQYLGRLKLKRAATYGAVYDQANLSGGRCRMTYVPQKGSHITIGNAGAGSATSHQRSNHDAQRLASNMGGGARIVEGSK